MGVRPFAYTPKTQDATQSRWQPCATGLLALPTDSRPQAWAKHLKTWVCGDKVDRFVDMDGHFEDVSEDFRNVYVDEAVQRAQRSL